MTRETPVKSRGESDRRASSAVDMHWGIRIPLRDGTGLSAILYLPSGDRQPAPCLFAFTPYTAQRNHARGRYFASNGYPFLVVDVRGRGNSEGTFHPDSQDGKDGHDVVEWIATQSYCNGKVAMYSGSYEGRVQWMTASEFPPHLVTIAPGMASAPGIDVPMRNNISTPYSMQWLLFVAGHTSQERIFDDQQFWRGKFRDWYESGRPFRELDVMVGCPSSIFQEWVSHPALDSYWDAYLPSGEDYASLDIPILTLTGSYDADQPGALHYYHEQLKHGSQQGKEKHYLVIGPWDHGGTLAPKAEFGGLKCGPAALVNISQLHLDWYDWTMRGGEKPAFLQKRVAYYVMGAEKWRYADALDQVTARYSPFYLHSSGKAIDVFHSGFLSAVLPSNSDYDCYVYDPRDVSLAEFESTLDSANWIVDQRMIHSRTGKQLVYHSAPFEEDTEVSGFFKFSVWISIDQLDTDFRSWVYEIDANGSCILLTMDSIRARYRRSLREAALIRTEEPLRYDFDSFTFTSRLIKKGYRLRLILGPVDSIHEEKNYNRGGIVAEESMQDARPVSVKVFHDSEHPSALYVPVGRDQSPGEPIAPASSFLSSHETSVPKS